MLVCNKNKVNEVETARGDLRVASNHFLMSKF